MAFPPMGGMELLIILAIILLFFGAKRVPELGRSLGKSMREFREGASSKDLDDDEAETRELKEGRELTREKETHPSAARTQTDPADIRDEWRTEQKS